MKQYTLYIEENGVYWTSKFFSVLKHAKLYGDSYFKEHKEKGGYITNNYGKILKRYEAKKTAN